MYKASKMALIALLLSITICSEVFAEDNSAPAPQLQVVKSLKDVNIICIGYINGDPIETAQLKTDLEKELKSTGFQVTSTNCDATLIGSLDTRPSKFSAFRDSATHSQTIEIASAQMSLITGHYQTLWKDSFRKSQWVPLYAYPFVIATQKKKGYVKNNGIHNCSIDIALNLAKAKGKAK